MNHVVKRTVTALSVASLVVLAILYLPVKCVLPALVVLITLVHLEFSKMMSLKYEVLVLPGVLMGLAFTAPFAMFGFSNDWLLISLIALGLGPFAIALCALFGKTKKPMEAVGMTLLGFAYIPLMLSALLFFLVMFQNLSHGNHYFSCSTSVFFLYLIAIVKISDMGGFAFGIAFGKHKMCPSISPNKSWEGMAGSIFASCLLSCIFMPLTHLGFAKAIVYGVVAAVVGTLGDLVESRFKREAGVKDSSQFKWTNGMGGFLDMFDSLIFAPVFFIIMLFFWS